MLPVGIAYVVLTMELSSLMEMIIGLNGRVDAGNIDRDYFDRFLGRAYAPGWLKSSLKLGRWVSIFWRKHRDLPQWIKRLNLGGQLRDF